MGHMAEAIMTKSFINPRARKFFKEKEEVFSVFFFLFVVSLIYDRFKRIPIMMVKWQCLVIAPSRLILKSISLIRAATHCLFYVDVLVHGI